MGWKLCMIKVKKMSEKDKDMCRKVWYLVGFVVVLVILYMFFGGFI